MTDLLPQRRVTRTPEETVAVLEALYAEASTALRDGLERFLTSGVTPTLAERTRYRYPELTITYSPDGLVPTSARAFAKFAVPGVYTTTITQPSAFKNYLIEQLRPLMEDFEARVEVGVSTQDIPYPYVFESGDELGRGKVSAADLARFFPPPRLSEVGDEIADGLWDFRDDRPRPLALFDAVRVLDQFCSRHGATRFW